VPALLFRTRADLRSRWKAWLGVAVPTVSALRIAALAAATLVVANVVAILPGRAAARVRPALVLRSE
jgi:hypothetical protein